MNKDLLNNSIILIAPKATGKSTLAKKFEEQNPDYLCFSTDLLINMLIYRLAGREKDLSLDQDYFNTLEKYAKIFDFDELDDIILEIGKHANNEKLSSKVKHSLVQFWKVRLVEMAIDGLYTKRPIFVDASADFGAEFDLSDAEQQELYNTISMQPDMVLDRCANFIKSFGHVVYLEPSSTYHKNRQERAHDTSNEVFLSNPESYKKHATTTLSTEDLFLKNGNSETAILNESKLSLMLAELSALKNTPTLS